MSHGNLHSRVSHRGHMGSGYEAGGRQETTAGDPKGNRLGHCSLTGSRRVLAARGLGRQCWSRCKPNLPREDAGVLACVR
jgi:hypothetical protein